MTEMQMLWQGSLCFELLKNGGYGNVVSELEFSTYQTETLRESLASKGVFRGGKFLFKPIVKMSVFGSRSKFESLRWVEKIVRF